MPGRVALQGANTQTDTGYIVPVRMFVFRVRQHWSTSQKVHSGHRLDAEQSHVCCVMLGNFPKPHVSKPQTSLLQVMAAAKVCEITHESPSVKSLRLLVADKDFSFKAGQWWVVFPLSKSVFMKVLSGSLFSSGKDFSTRREEFWVIPTLACTIWFLFWLKPICPSVYLSTFCNPVSYEAKCWSLEPQLNSCVCR